MSENSQNTAIVENENKQELQPSANQAPKKSWLEGVAGITQLLDPKQRLTGAILLAVLAASVAVMWKVPADKYPWIWLTILLLILLFAAGFFYFSSDTRRKLAILKQEKREWIDEKGILSQKIESLRDQYNELASKNNSSLSEIDIKISTIHTRIENSENPKYLINELKDIASSIEEQINSNTQESLSIRDGIDAISHSSEYADMMVRNLPERERRRRIKRKP